MISLNVNIHKSVKIAAPAGFFPLCLVIDTHTYTYIRAFIYRTFLWALLESVVRVFGPFFRLVSVSVCVCVCVK